MQKTRKTKFSVFQINERIKAINDKIKSKTAVSTNKIEPI